MAQLVSCALLAVLLFIASVEAEGNGVNNPNCIMKDPATGDTYNLNALANPSADYPATSTDGRTYYANMCIPVITEGCPQNSAGCQYAVSVSKWFSLGDVSTFTLTAAGNADGAGAKGVVIDFIKGTDGRSAKYVMICDPTASPASGTVSVAESTAPAKQYTYTWKTSYACPVGGGISPGSILLISLACGVFLYVVVGLIVKKFVMHAEGTDIIPNKDFWTSVPGLVQHGGQYVYGKIFKRNQYQSV